MWVMSVLFRPRRVTLVDIDIDTGVVLSKAVPMLLYKYIGQMNIAQFLSAPSGHGAP